MPFTVKDLTVTPTNVHPTCTHPLFNSNKLYDTKIDPDLHNVTTDSVLLYDGSVWTYDNIYSLFGSKDYGVFCSIENQNMPRANLPVPMTYNYTELSKGVSVVNYGGVNNSGIKVQTTGIYNIQFSAQISKSQQGSGQPETVYIWFSKNGLYIPRSNSSIVSTNTHTNSRVIAAWNIVLDLVKDDIVQIYWVSSDIHIQLLFVDQQTITSDAPIVTTIMPSIPSVILTVTQL